MAHRSSRRQFMAGAAGTLAAAGLMTSAPWVKRAAAKESIVVVEWGSNYIEATKDLAGKQDKVDIAWELHAGGSAAILAKIKANWPQVRYDLVASWDPVFLSMIREDWAETVTVDTVPHLADVPKALIKTDAQGNWKNIPRTLTAIYWAYREDTAPIKIQGLNDLLDPKLKGQIVFPDPIMNTNMQMIMLSLERGGNERNMEPGWAFMKELAKSGNIGRIGKTETDIVNALTSGETSVALGNPANFSEVARAFPVKHLTKVPNSKGMKTAIVTEGWTIMKGGKTKGAAEFANFTMEPANNAAFNQRIGTIPTNKKSKVDANLQHLVFNDDELKEFAYFPDWSYVSEQVDGWVKRWESDIVPLLK